MLQKVQTKVPYISGTPENKHQQTHPLQSTPIRTTPTKINITPKTDSYTRRHYSPPKNTFVKENLVLITNTEPHLKNSFSKGHSASTTAQPPVHRRNTKKAQNQTWNRELTFDLESKAISPPKKHRSQPNNNAARRQLPISKQKDRLIRIQHTKSKTGDMACGRENINQEKKKKSSARRTHTLKIP